MPCGPPKPRKAVLETVLVLRRRVSDRDVGQPIAVAGVKHRAVADAGRQVRRAAAARVEHHLVAGDHALVVVADAPVGAEIVALAGQREIVVAIEADLARLARHPRGERGDRRPGAGLALLAAEAAAHAAGLDGDERVGDAENARDDVLRLGRVLRRGVHRHLVALRRERRTTPDPRDRNAPARRSRSSPSSRCAALSIALVASPRPKA